MPSGAPAGLPPCALHAGAALPAPVLVVPRVLEPGLCRHLIALYRADGGEDSGFMLETEGRTVMTTDAAFKRRRDHQKELTLGSLGIGIPLLAIAGNYAGVAGIALVCCALAIIAIVAARTT